MGRERGSMFPQSPYSVGEEGGGWSLAFFTAAASAEEASLSHSLGFQGPCRLTPLIRT